MINQEHPKSTVYRMISQKFNQSKNNIIEELPNVIIHTPEFSHEYKSHGNINIFKCLIVLTYSEQIIKFVSDTHSNKKDCEYDVFQKILNFLSEKLNTQHTNSNICTNTKIETIKKQTISIFDLIKEDYDMSNTIIVIVDFENISCLDQVAQLYNVVIPKKTIYVVKVAGFCSSVKQNADIIVRSNRKDAVDHYISYLIGLLESKEISPIIYIVSRDKFGSCLQDFCKNVTHCSDVSDFLHYIK
jgi:hypothetical protein